MPRKNPLVTLAMIALVTLAAGACGGGGGGGGGGGSSGGGSACSESSLKQFVSSTTREWYLYTDLLPANVDPAAYAKAADLLDALTAGARSQGKDRYWSYLTTRTADNTILGEGQFNGFGFRTRTDSGNRPFVLEVFENSPASEAGMQRGDEIVAVDSGSGLVPVSQLLADGSTISDALGPADVGVVRGLRLLRNGATRDVSMTKRTVTIDPVPDSYGVKVFPLAGTTGVGYVALRSYISTADSQLHDAFALFRAQGLQYYIVDLRYNGGGLLSISELVNNLLGGARSTSDVQYRMTYNPAKSSRDSSTLFAPGKDSVQPVRIAFLTTDATASASEININSQQAWVETAIVGQDTYGKPVGQMAFDVGGQCDDRLRLITFKTVNKLGQGDYYDGLAGSMTFACAATDTLDKPLGDPTEGLAAAALDWLKTGSCAAAIAPAATGAAKPGGATDRYPLPRHPSAAQHWLPGLN